MSATPYLLQPPLAVGFARLGFGSLSLESLRERYAARPAARASSSWTVSRCTTATKAAATSRYW